MVSAKVVTSTIFCTVPVFQTDCRSAGLMVRKPMRISRPARAGMATWPTRPANATITTAITTLAITRAWRDRAPAALFSADADMDPPTGIPWKTPATGILSRTGNGRHREHGHRHQLGWLHPGCPHDPLFGEASGQA